MQPPAPLAPVAVPEDSAVLGNLDQVALRCSEALAREDTEAGCRTALGPRDKLNLLRFFLALYREGASRGGLTSSQRGKIV